MKRIEQIQIHLLSIEKREFFSRLFVYRRMASIYTLSGDIFNVSLR